MNNEIVELIQDDKQISKKKEQPEVQSHAQQIILPSTIGSNKEIPLENLLEPNPGVVIIF